MAQNNFENEVRKTLEERKIKPTAEAWQTLQSRLDSKPKQPSKRHFWVWGVAASLIGVLLVSPLFFTTDNQSSVPKEREHVPAITSKNALESTIKESDTSSPEIKKVTDSKALNNTEMAETKTKNKHNLEQQTKQEKEDVQERQSLVAHQELTPDEDEKEEAMYNKAIVGAKPQSKPVSDAYLEGLLNEAEQRIHADESLARNTIQSVDSDKLLEHIEYEIEDSFREKVFDAIKTGFGKVKTAVVERNK